MKTKILSLASLLMLSLFAASSALAAPGAVDTTFNPSINGTVYAVIAQPDGKILVGGSFSSVNGISRQNIARLYPDGTIDLFYSNSVAGTIYTMLKQPDGRLLIGGSFSTVQGQTRYDVARLNVDGSLDGTFNTSNTLSGTVYSLCVQSDGKILIGGSYYYTYYNQSISNYRYMIMRVNTDGSLDSTFNAGFNSSSGAINSMAQQADGKILIGGSFSSFGLYGLTRNNVARLGTDGTPDVSYPSVPTAGNGVVRSLYLQSDGKSVWAGDLTSLENYQRGRIGRLNGDGTMDTGSFALAGANNSIYAAAQDTNSGNIYIAGTFTTYNNSFRGAVARLFSDGTSDSSYTSVTNLNTSAQVKCLAIQPDGRVLLGGLISTFNGIPRTNLVRLYSDLYPAEIVTQPKGRNVAVGSNVTFSVNLSNPTAANYQWRKDGVTIPGATLAQYSVFNTQFSDAGNYSVFVNTGAGGITSSNALLQVGIPITITQQPVNLTVTQGQDATFTVGASGSPLYYAWAFNGSKRPGATNASFTITNCAPVNAGSYNVTLTNFLGTNVSLSATLTVVYPISIVTQPIDQYSTVGGSATFGIGATGNPIHYQWLRAGVPIPGEVNSTYTITNISLSDVVAYSVVVSNQFGFTNSTSATLILGNPPVVTQQPLSNFLNEGATATLSCTVTGTAPISYQWQFNSVPILNQTNTTLVLSNLGLANVGLYSMVAGNNFGSTISSNATISLTYPAFDSNNGLVAWYPFNGNANDATTNNVNGTNNGATLVTDRFGNTNSAYEFFGTQNITFTNLPLTQTDNWTISTWFTLDSLSQLGMVVALGNDNAPGPDNGMELGISDGNFGFGQSVFGSLSAISISSGYSVPNLSEWHQAVMLRRAGTSQLYVDGVAMGAPSTNAPTTPTSFTIGSSALGRYFQGKVDEVRIYNRALTDHEVSQLYTQETGAPYITQQPQSLSLLVGQPASFVVQAGGQPTLLYQWYTNGLAIIGATNSTLTLPSVQLTDSATYNVFVSNNYGYTSSSNVLLVVGQPPQTIQYQPAANKSFAIQMAGTPGYNYVLQTTTNIVPPVVWTSIATNSTGTNGIWSYVDTNMSTTPARFYRISSH